MYLIVRVDLCLCPLSFYKGKKKKTESLNEDEGWTFLPQKLRHIFLIILSISSYDTA